jgi:glucokinase
MNILGLDIGGTKCGIIYANAAGKFLSKKQFATSDVTTTLNTIYRTIEAIGIGSSVVFGISCGGPLDSHKGLILSPPNLPGWDEIAIVEELTKRFGGKGYLMNDANAGAVAEHRFGAGKGAQNMIFLTYGTGMGGGFILNGKLYEGTNDFAGEVGHIRLEDDGPVGYGKAGSFEGFCSGGGIARMAQAKAQELNGKVAFNKNGIDRITAKDVAAAAMQGDEIAMQIFQKSGKYAGKALSLLIDILNPEVIILGSLFSRCRGLLEKPMIETLKRETLEPALQCCRIVPTALGEEIGDYAAVSVALYRLEQESQNV